MATEDIPAAAEAPPPSWRGLMPKETGGWGIVGEALIAGLILARAWPAAGVALALLLLFCCRQPLRLLLLRRAGDARAAGLFAVSLVSGAGLLIAAAGSVSGWLLLLPLTLTAGLGTLQLLGDLQRQSRALLPELAGAVGMSAGAAAIVLAGANPWRLGAVLAVLLIIRQMVTITAIRFRLRRARGQHVSSLPVAIAMVLSLAAAAALGQLGYLDWLAGTAVLGVMIRVATGMVPESGPIKAKQIGFQELGVGLLYAILCGLSLRF